jgi:hypothetical protein
LSSSALQRNTRRRRYADRPIHREGPANAWAFAHLASVEQDGAGLDGAGSQELGTQRVDEVGVVAGVGDEDVALVRLSVEQLAHYKPGPPLVVERRDPQVLRSGVCLGGRQQ